jgi:predicted site-specific integrase-resolvase
VRVAIYARVSTDDKGQDPENQLRELRDWVTDSGHSTSITRVAGTARKSVSNLRRYLTTPQSGSSIAFSSGR